MGPAGLGCPEEDPETLALTPQGLMGSQGACHPFCLCRPYMTPRAWHTTEVPGPSCQPAVASVPDPYPLSKGTCPARSPCPRAVPSLSLQVAHQNSPASQACH